MLGPMLAAFVLTLAPADDAIPVPAKATVLTLDFRDRPIGEAAEELGRRAGLSLVQDNPRDGRWKKRTITLEVPGPVSLLEALDRFCETASISRYSNASRQPLAPQEREIRLTHQGEPAQSSATVYVGAFRLGPLTLIEQGELNFVSPPTPALPTGPVPPPSDPSLLPVPDGPVHVEIMVTPEPGRLCLQAGPLHSLVAVDERGQTLLSPGVSKDGLPPPPGGLDLGELGGLLKIPLEIPANQPGRVIARIAGKLPLDVAARSVRDPVTVKLADAKGRTIPLGGAALTVREVAFDGDRKVDLHLTLKLDGPQPASTNQARDESFGRLMGYASLAVEALDAQGKRAKGRTVSMSASADELRLGLTFGASAEAGLPTELRTYELERARWDLPFEFKDIPLGPAPGPRGADR
ncbi:hypothetical protein EP7_001580 [Isosphaeraceae bacterium EP7]